MSILDSLKQNPVASGIGLATGGAIIGSAVGSHIARHSKTRKRHKHSTSRSRTHRRTRRNPHTAGKRKDRSHKRIRYTKRGQPYIIKANGRAQFISHRSASSSHKRKGGKY